jgi:integrase
MVTFVMTSVIKPIAKRGTCSIDAINNRLRIRLPRSIGNGKQIYLYAGMDDTPINRKKAQTVALMIETDIECSKLDISLNRYKAALKELSGKQTIEIVKKTPQLSELWDKYALFKESQVTKAYFYNHYVKLIPDLITKLPSQDINKALEIRDYLLSNYTANATKRYLTQFNACAKWAVTSKLITSNPFDGLATSIKVPKYSWTKIDPFSPEEQQSIIAAFDTELPEYSDFVRFAFWTGARLGEIIALQWHHVNRDCNEIYFCETLDRKYGRKDTKNYENRRFPCNQQIRELLTRLRAVAPVSNRSVFLAPDRNSEIKLDLFLRIWHGKHSRGSFKPGIVSRLVQLGEVSRYRSPYNMRHTFISQCLERGISAAQVSRWVGNSPQTIYQHYAGVSSASSVPEL